MRRLLPLMIMLLVTIGMKAENPVIELQETSPAAGENYSVNDAGGNVVFTFNRQVTVENAWIVPASGDPVAITDRWGTQILKFYYYCGISSQMRELMLSGTIKAGETFRIELDGIKVDCAITVHTKETPKPMVKSHAISRIDHLLSDIRGSSSPSSSSSFVNW